MGNDRSCVTRGRTGLYQDFARMSVPDVTSKTLKDTTVNSKMQPSSVGKVLAGAPIAVHREKLPARNDVGPIFKVWGSPTAVSPRGYFLFL